MRAYITPVSGSIVQFAGPGRPFGIILTFKNNGQTPGYELTICGSNTFAAYPLREVLDQFTAATVCGILGPDVEYTINMNLAPLTAEQIQAVNNGNAAIYTFGTYLYKDAFGKSRTGEFRFYYGKGNISTGTALSFHPEGNKGD